MIVSTVQITLLLATAWRLSSFDKSGCRYRPVVSFIAAVWAGSCLALSVAIAFRFPERLSMIDIFGCIAAALGCAAAWYYGGNVARILRAARVISD